MSKHGKDRGGKEKKKPKKPKGKGSKVQKR